MVLEERLLRVFGAEHLAKARRSKWWPKGRGI